MRTSIKRLVVGATALLVLAPVTAGASQRDSVPAWRVGQFFGGTTGSDHRSVADVTAVSSREVWAVGVRPVNLQGYPLIRRWDGARWREFAAPADVLGGLYRVIASSPRNVWVFGKYNYQPNVRRWDGRSWSKVPAPPFNVTDAGDAGVALSARDVWVLSATGTSEEYAQRWNGRRWRPYRLLLIVPFAVTEAAADDIWVAGRRLKDEAPSIAHWNGTRWRAVTLPTINFPGADGRAYLEDVVALSSRNVWAVGQMSWAVGTQRYFRPVVMRWDGRAWKLMPTPDEAMGLSVAEKDGSGGLWVVADPHPDSSFPFGDKTLWHYARGVWTRAEVLGLPNGTGLDEVRLTNVPGTRTMWAAALLRQHIAGDWRSSLLTVR